MIKPTILGDGTVVAGGIREPKTNVFFRMSIFGYEILEGLIRDLYIESSNIKLSLADSFIQLFLLCNELNIDIEKLKNKSFIITGNEEINLVLFSLSIGKLMKDLVYYKRFSGSKYRNALSTSLRDVLTILLIIIKKYNFDEDEIVQLGLDHLRERYKEFKDMGWK